MSSRRDRQSRAVSENMVKRGVVTRTYFDGAAQSVQATMLDDEDADVMPVYGPQGVAFRIPVDAEVLVAHPMGDADLPSCIGTDQRGKRPTEKPGGGDVPEGAGGLHFLGAWRVYVSDDGKVFLGGATDESEPALLGATAVTIFNAHVHPSPFGPTGVSTSTLDSAKSARVFVI